MSESHWTKEVCADCRNVFIISPYRCTTCSAARLDNAELAAARAEIGRQADLIGALVEALERIEKKYRGSGIEAEEIAREALARAKGEPK